MQRVLLQSLPFVGLTAIMAAACGGPSNGSTMGTGGMAGAGTGGSAMMSSGTGGSSTATTSSSSTGGGGPVWTAIALQDDTANGITYAGQAIVTGVHFDDKTHGAVTMMGMTGGPGAIQHLNGPTTVDKIAFSGKEACDTNDCAFIELTVTSAGLVAYTDDGAVLIASTDKGSTWTSTQSSADKIPNSAQIFLGADSAGVWHQMDNIGNVWTSPTAPSPTATWTRTWQPGYNTWGGQDPNSDPLPADDCQVAFPGGYYAFDPHQVFWMSPDGKTMIYGNDDADPTQVGVCRSTDGGLEFKPVFFPNPPSGANGFPYVILFTTATHGIVAYGNELGDEANSYVYVTDDAGATWKAGTLPSSATVHVSITGGFASPSGDTMWLVGRGGSNVQPVLLKSTDKGNSWKDISTGLRQLIAGSNGETAELHAGFALDDKNIWVGGDAGGLFYSPSGGE